MSDDPVLHVLTAQSDAAKRGALAVWTVYDRPDDYPYGFIARMVEVASGGTTTPTSMVLTGELAGLRPRPGQGPPHQARSQARRRAASRRVLPLIAARNKSTVRRGGKNLWTLPRGQRSKLSARESTARESRGYATDAAIRARTGGIWATLARGGAGDRLARAKSASGSHWENRVKRQHGFDPQNSNPARTYASARIAAVMARTARAQGNFS